jgi:hypothetical protein
MDPPGLVLRQVRLYLADPDGSRSATLNVSALSADVPGAVMFARRVARHRLGWPECQSYVEKVTLADGTEVGVPPACLLPPLPSGPHAEERLRRAPDLGYLVRARS